MTIIYQGLVRTTINVDNANELLTLDHLGSGSIVRPFHFLINRKINFNLQAVTKVIAFRLELSQFVDVCSNYPEITALIAKETK